MSDFWRDVRFGLRLLRHSPVFAIAVVLLLGIGIGVNTLIFSMADALLLRPLPVRQADRLVRLVEVHPTGFVTWDMPYVVYEQLAKESSSFSDVLCQGNLDVAFEQGAFTERIRINAVSTNFFSALGIGARLGRVLNPSDEDAAVLSYDFWQRRFQGSPSVVGRSIRLNGRSLTVVGVLANGMNGLTVETSPEVRIPLAAARWFEGRVDFAQVFGILRPGVSRERAEAEIAPRLHYSEEVLQGGKNVFRWRWRLENAGHGISTLRGQFSRGLLLLMAAVGLLLLMACGNVACLLLARSAARAQEMGVRLALGASRWRVARQLLSESLLLAALGGGLGVLVAYMLKPLLLAALPPIRDRAAVAQPLAIYVAVDGRVLAFAIAVSILTALLCGLSPALWAARRDLASTLRGSRTTTGRLPGRNILLAAQVAVCVLLLGGAGLLVKTFERMQSMDAGFDQEHVITFTIDPGIKGYKPEQAKLLSQKLLEETRSLPGIASASIGERGLMRGTGLKATFEAAGKPVSRNDFLNSSIHEVTPGYFDTLGIHILAGRDFNWSDDNKQKPQKVIVNRAFVRRFFPGQDALGKLFGARGPDGLAMPQDRIVGVVSDAKYRSLREPIPPTVYSPVVNGFEYSFILHVRTQDNPATVIAPVRAILRRLAPGLPFVEVQTLRQEVEASLWQERLLAWLSTLFGGFAALLAGIGLYGSLDFGVKARRREIGVRAALGASPSRLVRFLSREALLVVGAGAAMGVAFYAASAKWIRQALYGVTTSDPLALAAALLAVAIVVLLAIASAVWRASRMDAASALRQE
ncbi:MAG TPA: ABC transporter permease [Bryobacteraceae bacterium]